MAAPFAIKPQHQTENRSHAKPADDIPIEPFEGCDREIRTIAPRLPFLVPGIGAQGGSVEKAVTNGQTPDGTGLIINSSRGIIYAGGDEEFAEAARDAATLLRDDINQYRA